jgi:prepilin-type processing-associated H-X9-DG protein
MLAADGTSTTLMLTEILTRQQPQDQRGAWAIAWNGASVLALDMHHGEGAHGYDLSGYTVSSEVSFGLTQRPNTQGPNLDMIYDCVEPADAQFHRLPCNSWKESGSNNYLSSAPRSRHPGGVNVVFVDGHVGFLTNQVDETALAYLISIEDGRAVQLP